MLWARLKGDFELAILSLFGAAAVAGILPFALYRFATGDVWIGLVDTLIIAAIIAPVGYAWRSGNTGAAGLFLALFNSVGLVATCLLLGRDGLPWTSLTVVTSFLLTTRHVAALTSATMLLVLALDRRLFGSTLELVTFVVTTGLVGVCTFMFAQRSAAQREQLLRLASRDALTNSGNRRQMELELTQAARWHGSEQLPCTLVVFDFDHFKRVNDEHGHAAGDRVLIEFANLIRQETRKQDRLYRFGGEEFALLLPATDSDGARQLLQHLQSTLRANLRSPGGPISVSIGAAPLHSGEDWSRWLARCDAAMYAAKGAGRDCLVFADDGVPELPSRQQQRTR